MKLHLFILLVIISGCNQTDIKKEYRYYENGAVLSERTWKKDKLDGKLIHYYQSGDTMEVQNYINGLKQGKTTKYYPNGIIKEVMSFKNDTIVGEYVWYRADQSIESKQRFDSYGNVTHQYAFDKNGKIFNDQPFMYTVPETDTLIVNKLNKFSLNYMNLDSNMTAGVNFGSLVNGENTVELRDTLDIITKIDDKYFITLAPKDTGLFVLSGLWYTVTKLDKDGGGIDEFGNRVDTIQSTAYYVFEKKYFVK